MKFLILLSQSCAKQSWHITKHARDFFFFLLFWNIVISYTYCVTSGFNEQNLLNIILVSGGNQVSYVVVGLAKMD